MRRLPPVFLVVVLLAVALPAAAASRAPSPADPPMISWQPPATFSLEASGSRTPLTNEIGPGPAPFFPITPCRQYDSRSATSLADNTPRAVTMTGAPCGVPGNTFALAVNITVFNILGAGSNGVFKVGSASPPTTAWINYPSTEAQRGNAGVVATNGTSMFVQVNQGAGSVDFVVDVYGYYYNGYSGAPWTMPDGDVFSIVGNTSSPGYPVIFGRNDSTAADTFGILGRSYSSGAGSAGVWGDAKGVTGQVYGVLGTSASTSGQAYGVVGLAGGVSWNPVNSYQAGGRFAASSASSYGAQGEGETGGFIGYRVDNTGAWQTYGIVGYAGTDGLYTPQHLTAIGGKSFAEPLPADPSRVIKYVCPEGPESGTYFRGRGHFEGHLAVIEVPEHFRTVTAEDGLTVQVTPIGRAAAVGVVRIGLDQIVVESTQDTEFSYLVQGVRKAYKDWNPVQSATPRENPYFIPLSADQTLDKSWPEEIRQRLISNGTYNADGTVNMQTAERMGWAQRWREEAKARAGAGR